MENMINDIELVKEVPSSRSMSDCTSITNESSANHHYHHHGHSRRHHRHRQSSTQGNNKTLKPKLIPVLSVVVAGVLVALMVLYAMVDFRKPNENLAPMGSTLSDILLVEIVNEEGLLVKEAVEQYLMIDLLNSYYSTVRLSDFAKNDGRLDEQVPVILTFSTKDGSGLAYKIELSSDSEFKEAKVAFVDGPNGVYEFKHLHTNTEYFYRVTVYTAGGVAFSTGQFKTADTPRILSIDGLYNVRDIGNWRTDSGRRIKQGILLRGSEMDGAIEDRYHLSDEGMLDMLSMFGIKTDLDLRAQSFTSKDSLGTWVEHRYFDMVQYGEIFTDSGKDKVRAVFAELADPNNYPIYLHCTYGNDRTGTICYLLEAVLGVSRGDCLKDYGLSNLYLSNILIVEDGLKNYEGNTLKEQAESFLLSCGVTKYQIESIRNIFLQD